MWGKHSRSISSDETIPARLVFEMKEKKKVFCLLLAACLLYHYTLTQICSNPFANRDYRLYYSYLFHSTSSLGVRCYELKLSYLAPFEFHLL